MSHAFTGPIRSARRPARLGVERLEDRTVPTVWVVTNTFDAGSGSVRDAVNQSADGDTVVFDLRPSDHTIGLTSGKLFIGHSLDILGPGADQVTVEREPRVGQELTPEFRIIEIGPKAAVTIRLDRQVLEWFKAQGRGYQTRINALLRAYMEAHKT